MEDRLVERFDPAKMHRAAKAPLICIYDSPEDWPGKFVARLWDMQRPTPYVAVADSLEELRALIPTGMMPLPRDPRDAGCIVETWI